MSKRSRWLPIATAISVAAGSATAHHAFSPVYDANRTISKEGTLTELKLVNPHVMMTIETTDDSGKPAVWTVETVGRLNLVAAGWNQDSLKVGERVTIVGNPTHTGSARMFAQRVVKADGAVLVLSSRSEGFEEIDAARRARQNSGAEPAEPVAPK
jgi:hypothetical protein